jgi:hypothetical protein
MGHVGFVAQPARQKAQTTRILFKNSVKTFLVFISLLSRASDCLVSGACFPLTVATWNRRADASKVEAIAEIGKPGRQEDLPEKLKERELRVTAIVRSSPGPEPIDQRVSSAQAAGVS